MQLTATQLSGFKPTSPAMALRWWVDALSLWRRAPFTLLVMGLTPLAVEFLLQQIPQAGMILSKFLTPLVSAGVPVAINELAQGKKLRARFLLAGFQASRLRSLLILNLLSLSVLAVQLLSACLVYGLPTLDLVLWEHPHPELMSRAFVLTLILPGVLPSTLLLLAQPLILFQGVSPTKAVALSIRRWWAAPAAFFLFLSIAAVLLAVSLGFGFGVLLLLLLQPWVACVSYIAYRDLLASPWEAASTASVPLR